MKLLKKFYAVLEREFYLAFISEFLAFVCAIFLEIWMKYHCQLFIFLSKNDIVGL